MSASGGFVKSVITKGDLPKGHGVVFWGDHTLCQSLFIETFDAGVHTLKRYNLNLRNNVGTSEILIQKASATTPAEMQKLLLNGESVDMVGIKQFFSVGTYRRDSDTHKETTAQELGKSGICALEHFMDHQTTIDRNKAADFFRETLTGYKIFEEAPKCVIS